MTRSTPMDIPSKSCPIHGQTRDTPWNDIIGLHQQGDGPPHEGADDDRPEFQKPPPG